MRDGLPHLLLRRLDPRHASTPDVELVFDDGEE
jgi:hypothetical protein